MTDSDSSYFCKYYKKHRYELRMKSLIRKAYSREDTKIWYLRKAKELLPLVKIEKAEHERLEALLTLKKVPKVLPPPVKKKPLKKKDVKYKVIDDDSFILDFN